MSTTTMAVILAVQIAIVLVQGVLIWRLCVRWRRYRRASWDIPAWSVGLAFLSVGLTAWAWAS